MKILLVEDTHDLAEVVVELLETHYYAVDHAEDGYAADELMAVNDYDLVVLDWGIPGLTGLELLQRWRAADVSTPVLMLTARGALEDKISGFDTGADDYLTKPFSYEELLARVRALLRRRQQALPPLVAGDLVMHRAGRQVTVGGEEIEMAPKEFAILELLLFHSGEVVSRTELVEHAWDQSFDAMSNVVDVTIYRLRRKIDAGRKGKLLETIKGVGYRLRKERG
jgi:DNA-binding response OmpR family regulator